MNDREGEILKINRTDLEVLRRCALAMLSLTDSAEFHTLIGRTPEEVEGVYECIKKILDR